MKVNFFWNEVGDGREPSCHSDVIGIDGVDFLSCLLSDNGGQQYKDTVKWLNEGLSRIQAVKYNAVSIAEWIRDSWGAELSGEMAKIYSLYDDDYFEVISIDDLEEAIVMWREFLCAG